jgi:hypothetical protein
MRAGRTAVPVLTAAAGICAMLAGCASGTGAQVPAASTRNAAQQSGSLQSGSQQDGNQQGGSQRDGSQQGGSQRDGSQAGRPPQAPAAPRAPGSHSPASHRKAPGTLAGGMYTDGPDGTPHYALSLTLGSGGGLRGSASFLYQDGRVSNAGSYTGTSPGSGKITLAFGDGKALSGRYSAGRLNLAGCAAALPLATFTGGCTFTYHGHVP